MLLPPVLLRGSHLLLPGGAEFFPRGSVQDYVHVSQTATGGEAKCQRLRKGAEGGEFRVNLQGRKGFIKMYRKTRFGLYPLGETRSHTVPLDLKELAD